LVNKFNFNSFLFREAYQEVLEILGAEEDHPMLLGEIKE
jgi:hypothetical protein